MTVPLVASFWMMLAGYVIHIMDESLLGGSFVEKVRAHWWPEYSWRKFFWFNAGYLVVMGGSIVLYDRGGDRYLFLPLAWSIERFSNSLWHVWWAIRYREYSPGLVTCVLIWIQTYFLLAYRPTSEPIANGTVVLSLLLGISVAAFVSFYIPLVKGSAHRARITPSGGHR